MKIILEYLLLSMLLTIFFLYLIEPEPKIIMNVKKNDKKCKNINNV
jgi:hypothetical protein